MIIGYIGNLGTGKTLNAVYDLMENMKRGRKVMSNTPIRFTHKGKVYQSITITDLDDFNKAFINGFNIDIFMDELSVYLPSQYWNHVKPEFIMKFAQMRKFRCNLYYTEQGWTHGIKRIRDLTNWVWSCYKRKTLVPIPNIKIYKNKKGQIADISLSRHYLYKATLFPPSFFNHSFSDSKKISQYIIDQRTIYPATARRIFPAYNTYFLVKGSNLGKMGLVDKSFNLKKFEESQNVEALIKENTRLGDFDENASKAPRIPQDSVEMEKLNDTSSWDGEIDINDTSPGIGRS
jgi:hypothetical protein